METISNIISVILSNTNLFLKAVYTICVQLFSRIKIHIMYLTRYRMIIRWCINIHVWNRITSLRRRVKCILIISLKCQIITSKDDEKKAMRDSPRTCDKLFLLLKKSITICGTPVTFTYFGFQCLIIIAAHTSSKYLQCFWNSVLVGVMCSD